MTKKPDSPVVSQFSAQSALLASALREQRLESKELSSQVRRQEKRDRRALRRSLREAARDPLARSLGELMEARWLLRRHLGCLGLPEPQRWYARGEVLYGALDTQLLRGVPGEGDDLSQLVRLTSAGEVVVSGARDLLMAEPSPLDGLQELPQGVVRIAQGRSSRLLLGLTFFCAVLLPLSGLGGVLALLVYMFSPSLDNMMVALLLLGISAVTCVFFCSFMTVGRRADWLLRRARVRGFTLD